MLFVVLVCLNSLANKVASGKFENSVQYGKEQGMGRREQGKQGVSREREEEG